MQLASNKLDNAWKCIILPLLFMKLTYTVYLNQNIHLNVTHHWLSIGFNTFILATTASSCDVTTINVLMSSLVLACKWSIVLGKDDIDIHLNILKRKINLACFLLIHSEASSVCVTFEKCYCVVVFAPRFVQNKLSCSVLYHFKRVDQFVLMWVPDWWTLTVWDITIHIAMCISTLYNEYWWVLCNRMCCMIYSG